jgi:hypothetical protein
MTTMESDQFKHRINSTEIFHRFDDSNWKHGHDWIATWMESNCNQTTIELEYGGKEAKWINWRPHHAQTITSIAEGMAIFFSCHLAYVTLPFFQGSFNKKKGTRWENTANQIITKTLITQRKSKILMGVSCYGLCFEGIELAVVDC